MKNNNELQNTIPFAYFSSFGFNAGFMNFQNSQKIYGKQNETEGVTYAVSSKSLHQLLQNLPKEANLKLPKANKMARLSREQQVEKLEQYTFSVKVYKN